MYKLKIISSSVRPGRKGPAISEWIARIAAEHQLFEPEILDLGAIGLPLMNEPMHPVAKNYEHEHTRQWSAKIGEADAFIFVTAEYNYSYPAALKNALEYLHHEWAYKPSGLVGYSVGSFAGVRAIMSLKTDLLSLKNIALEETVRIPLYDQFLNGEQHFVPNDQLISSADLMFTELLRWTKGLKAIKEAL